MIFRTIWAVYKRELGVYFRSGIAYGIAFALTLFLGLYYSSIARQLVDLNLSPNQFGGNQTTTADDLVSLTLNIFIFLLFIVAPLLTMRLLSEETREGTLEVMMTLPIKDYAFVIGKFLAVWTYYTVLLGITYIYVIIANMLAKPTDNLVMSMYLGAWLYGGAVLALTMIWSAVTEDQIVSAFLGAATVLVFFLIDTVVIWAGETISQGVANFVGELGLTTHYHQTMMVGIIRAQDVLYFVLLILASLFITTRIIETRRWRA